MRIKAKLSFTGIDYTVVGHPELTGCANRPFLSEKRLIVKDSTANKEYKLQHPSDVYSVVSRLPFFVVFCMFFFRAPGPMLIFGMVVIIILALFTRERFDYFVDGGSGVKATNFFCSSRGKRIFTIEGNEYEVAKHSNFTYSVVKDGEQVAVYLDKNRGALISSTEGDFEVLYSEKMKGKEYILLLLFLSVDAGLRSKRNRGSRSIEWRVEKVFFDKYAERAHWRPENKMNEDPEAIDT